MEFIKNLIHLHLDHYIMDKTLYSVINHSDPFFWRSTCSLQDDLTKLATDIFHLSIRQWVNGRTGGQQPTWRFPFTQRSIWSVPFVIIVSHIYILMSNLSQREKEREREKMNTLLPPIDTKLLFSENDMPHI